MLIPIAVFAGLIGGLIPRYRWLSIPVIGFVWSIILALGGDPTMSVAQIWLGGFLIGAANGAVGVVFTWLVSNLMRFVWGLVGRSRMPTRNPTGG